MTQPTERIISLTLPANEYAIVDTAWCLSQLNRRAYRQGYEYAYEKIELFQGDPAQQATVVVKRMPHGWVPANAWVKAYHNWKGQQDDAMDDSSTQSMRAKYRDFKVCYNSAHAFGQTQSGIAVTMPTPHGALSLSAAQAIDSDARMAWEYSEFVVPNATGAGGTTVEYLGCMLGADYSTTKGLIQAYAESRARPQPEDPSIVTSPGAPYFDGGLYTEMIDVGEDMVKIMENVTERNDNPPYVVAGTDSLHEFYPGGSMHTGDFWGQSVDKLIVRASSFLSSDSMGPMTAYCGLLAFHNESEVEQTLRITVAPGTYQGVAARPMREVN